ncbi:MAG: hypothetical protein IJH32_10635 [Ruminococcus sp.]|nr:hypothetical protein [Ruminococcus sp.]
MKKHYSAPEFELFEFRLTAVLTESWDPGDDETPIKRGIPTRQIWDEELPPE